MRTKKFTKCKKRKDIDNIALSVTSTCIKNVHIISGVNFCTSLKILVDVTTIVILQKLNVRHIIKPSDVSKFIADLALVNTCT